MKVNNKGFSLLELLIVVALFSVMVGFASLTIAMVNNADVAKCANTYDSALDKAKTQCMSKGTDRGQLILTKQNGGLYYRIGDEAYNTKICSAQVKFQIEYTDSSIKTQDDFSDGTDIASISFNSAGMVIKNAVNIKSITFSNNNRRIASILYNETGKHEIQTL